MSKSQNSIFETINFSEVIDSRKKGTQRQLAIVESAIETIFEIGLEGFSFEVLSKKSKIRRSLIYHYFPTLEELYLYMAAYIRYKYQVSVLAEMKNKILIKDILRAYVSSALNWFDVNPKEACVWILYFVKCSQSGKIAKYNSEMVDMGTNRIRDLILAGVGKGEFNLQPDQAAQRARQIQIFITGQLISRATEKRSSLNWQHEFSSTIAHCMQLAGEKNDSN